MTERFRFNDFEPPVEEAGEREDRDLGEELGGHSLVLDGYVELEGGVRVHPDNPNLEVIIYKGGEE